MSTKEEFPSNSKNIGEPRKIQRVTTSEVIERKRPFLLRIFGENTQSVGNYILWDVLIPAAKSTITDIITNGIEMLLYGEPNRGVRRDRDRSFVSYNSMFRDRDRERPRERPARNRSRQNFDNIIIRSRQEAEEVLTLLVEQIENYDVATIADFCDLVGLETDWADNKYGWDNLTRASVRRVHQGYILDLPRPIALD